MKLNMVFEVFPILSCFQVKTIEPDHNLKY